MNHLTHSLSKIVRSFGPAFLAVILPSVGRIEAALPDLKMSENRRFLVTADGKPFFWLGDTAWEIFHRLTPEEADFYFKTRANQGFTVVQGVLLAEFDGLEKANAEGHRPLRDNDPTKPIEEYFADADRVVSLAEKHGLYMALLPTWGDKWNKKWGQGPEIFTPENAAVYGEWVGRRYRDRAVVWVLGGDRPIESERHKAIIRAMAEGLRRGDGGKHLITFHPTGGSGSADALHNEPWLDFNMRQNGHGLEYNRYAATLADYLRQPTKPVLDGEPIYEGHPVSFKAAEFGHSIAADVRRPLYWDLFSGAFGHTYGHHSIWQMWTPEREPVNNPLRPWQEAIVDPGAAQMKWGRKLMESRPFLSRVPDDSLIETDRVATEVPGAGTRRLVATRDADSSYAFVYFPVSKAAVVRLDKLSGVTIRATWFDPRTGATQPAGEWPRERHRFSPPTLGESLDWVLVLDDVAKNYPMP